MSSYGKPKQEDGIRAKNRDFKKYEQVNKDQEYNLVEGAGQEEFDEDFEIRTCDMSLFFEGGETGKRQFAQDLGEALEGIGFAILSGHGIDPSVFLNAEQKIAELFETTGVDDRMPFEAKRSGSVNQGYFPIKQTTIIHPDLVEGWVFCPGYEPVFREVVRNEERLILPIMQSLLRYLGCDPGLFDRKLIETSIGFRLNYYPPISDEDDSIGAGRMLGHEDVDLFTFLPAQNMEGLQVFNRKNGKWIRLNAPPGTIVLNTGDYMQRITNDRLPSTTHRVSKPHDPQHNLKARISMPMAVYVWEDEILEVLPGLGEPKYEPVTALEFHTSITSKYYGDEYAVTGDD
jgi:isopenicillin N synthase-like dioxygenase